MSTGPAGAGPAVPRGFGALRAEEEPWLEECFVRPRWFDEMADDRSVVVFGRPGWGRTALCRMLAQEARRWQRLPVLWEPAPPLDGAAGGSIMAHVGQAFDACGIALAEHLSRFTEKPAVPDWVRCMLGWFLHAFVQGDLSIRLGYLLEREPLLPGVETLREIIAAVPSGDLLPRHNVRLVAIELGKALESLGWPAVWVLVDPRRVADKDRAGQLRALEGFFSTLYLFEEKRFVYKWFLPAWSEEILHDTTGIERRRLDGTDLSWTPEELDEIVNRRLAWATGGKIQQPEDLYADPSFRTWLAKVGGRSPREWLDQVQPLLEHYLKTGGRPIDEKTLLRLRSNHTPRLFLDQERGYFLVGGWEIPLGQLSPRLCATLALLMEHPNRIVSKAEIYYRICLGRESVPRSTADEGYEGSAEYAGVVDTLLYRLRQAIEPDPDHPVLLETVRGHGVRLRQRL